MVQLQKDLEQIEKSGLQLVAISYDPAAELEKFAKAAKITFPLLSDPDSKTIKAYGILNEQAKGRAAGIPHPGTFIIDQKGVIRAKLFKDSYRVRHTPEELIEAAKKVTTDKK